MSAREKLTNWDSVTEAPDREEIYNNITACERADDYLDLLKEFRDNARARAGTTAEPIEMSHFLGAARMIDDLIADMREYMDPDPE